MSAAPRPGWYPDPAGTELYRWWDGADWTDDLSTVADVRPPEPPSRPGGSDVEERPRAGSPLRTLLVLTCGVALFVTAGLGVGLVIWREPTTAGTPLRDHPRSSPSAVAPGAGSVPQAPTGKLDESTGQAVIGRASMTLPGPPYELYDDPVELDGVFDALFVADAEVHEDYDGVHSWSATVGLAHVSPTVSGSIDLEQTGSAALLALCQRFFGGHRTTLGQVSVSDRSVDGHPGVLVRVNVHYAIARLPSRYDTVTALVVRLDDGSLVAAISSVPDDADAQVKALAQRSIQSLTIS